jgi:hypothetical protein
VLAGRNSGAFGRGDSFAGATREGVDLARVLRSAAQAAIVERAQQSQRAKRPVESTRISTGEH